MWRILAGCALAAALPAAELRVSGILGQSQPAEAPPLAAFGFTGVAVDGAGRLWAGSGSTLYAFAPDAGDRMVVAAQVALPTGLHGQASVQTCAGRIAAVLADARLALVDPTTAAVERVLALPPGTTRVHCPARSGPGAARFPVLALAGRQVLGLGLDGGDAAVVATVPEFAGTWVEAIGVLAGGDLVVGTGYPDMRQYRYAVAGSHWRQDGGWPRPGWPRQYLGIGDATWMLGNDGSVTPVDGEAGTGHALAASATGHPHGGLAPAGAGWWVACARGLVRFDADGRPAVRVGGLPAPDGVALSADGTVLALIGGQQVVRMYLDDGPLTAPDSSGTEPWRVGNGWTARATALAGEGDGALLLDAAAGRLWRFEPARTRWGDRPWTAGCPERALPSSGALAVGDSLVRVLADGRVLEADRRTLPLAFRELDLPLPAGFAPTRLACLGDDRVVVAGAGGIAAWVRQDGAFRLAWQVAGAAVAAIAVQPGVVVVAEPAAIRLFAGEDGRELAVLAAAAAPGGRLDPTALAVRLPWILVADRAGGRLLRLRAGALP